MEILKVKETVNHMVPWPMHVQVVVLMYLSTVVSGYVGNIVVNIANPITCWTCPNMTDNTACNNWAPDKLCPKNFSVCQTVHRIDVLSGKSISVNKKCAQPSECTLNMIGCRDTRVPGVQDCISCCNYAYCNEYVPINLTTAVMYSKLEERSRSNRQVAVLAVTVCLTALTIVSDLFCRHYWWRDLFSRDLS